MLIKNNAKYDGFCHAHWNGLSVVPLHMRNVTKVWKKETVPSKGDIAWSRGPESELFEILPYRDH